MKKVIKVTSEVVALVVMLAVAYTGFAAPGAGKIYKFAVRIESEGGISAGQFYDLVRKCSAKLKSESGITLEILNVKTPDESVEAFAKNKADTIAVWDELYLTLMKKNKKILPLVTYTIDKKPKRAFCLWTRKTDIPKNISGIKGKALIANDYSHLFMSVALRKILKENGLDEPLWKVFSTFSLAPNTNSEFIALGLGKADYLLENTDYDFFLKLANPAILSKVGHAFCSPWVYDRTVFIANPDTIPPKDYKEILSVLEEYSQHPEKHEEMKPYIPTLRMLKLKFITAPNVIFDAEKKLDAEAQKNGWYEEARYIEKMMKDVPPGKAVAIPAPKKSFSQCKTECKKAKNKDACIEACM